MKDDLQKTKEQLLAELEVLRTQSKEREEQLRAANQQLENFNKQLHAKNKLIEEKRAFAENLWETAPSFIVVLNTQGDIVRFNRFAENLSGYQKEEVLGKNWLKLFIPEEEKHQIDTVFKSMLKQIPDFSTNQNKIRLKNGEERMIQWTNSVLKDEAGNITGILSIGHDITEQLKIQKALEQKEKWLSALINATPDIICFKDTEGRWLIANEACLELFSLSGVDYFGKTDAELSEYTHPVFKEFLLQNMETDQKVFQTGKISVQEEYIKKPSEKTVILETIKIPIFTQEGKPDGLVIIGRDITVRKKTENDLIKSEEKIQTILDNSPLGIYVVDDKGKFVYINHAITEITGFTKQEVIGQPITPFIDEKYRDLVLKRYKDRIDGKALLSSYRFEINVKNGEKRMIEIHASKVIAPGGQNQIVSFIKDVTEESKQEALQRFLYDVSKISTKNVSLHDYLANIRQKLSKLIKADNFYVALYDAATDTYSFPYHIDQYDRFDQKTKLNLRGTITDYVRKTGKSLFITEETEKELAKKELITTIGEPTIVWLGVPLINSGTGKAMGTMAVQDYEDENAYTEKDLELLEIMAHNIGIFIDRVKTMQELKEAKEKAEESDRLKSAFLANMSHEIRTPMNGILGFTELLKEPHLTGEKMDEYIKIIEKSGQRMLNTINDIIDISKIEAGQVQVIKTEVLVNQILEEQHNFFYREAQSKGLELIYAPTLPDEETRIITDRQKLEGILINLIKNAIKFTKQGNITLGYSLKKGKESEYLEFYVKDTGIGISKDRIGAIFNRFEQADIEDKMVFEGSGLGLAISKSYVEMLGGTISVSSKKGSGSTFTFTLPYIKQKAKEARAVTKKGKEQPSLFSNLSILIAEDEEISIKLFKAIFKNTFRKITYTKTGKETIEQCRANPDTDIILMDIKMPDMNGYETTREIRKFNKDVIIIAQTAFAMPGNLEKALEAGCNDYITKPINKKLLFEKIQACLYKKDNTSQ